MKRRPTISGALAVIALLLAAGGTAYAASSYIITSAHQIKPSVLAQLQGQRGARGYTGKQGKTGANGTNGGTTNGAPPAQGVADNAGAAGAPGAAGQGGPAGANGTNGAAGAAGATGATGQVGAAGTNGTNGTDGTNGANGAAGAAGASGINSPLVVTASATSTGPDSGYCGTTWATDTYDRTWTIEPQADGSYTIYEQVKGTFVTTAGASEPYPSSCSDTSQAGGVTGTFYGVETWAVSAPGGESADFDPFAVCTSACDPTTTGSTSSNDQGNQAFEALFFPTATYAGVTNYDFVYHTDGNGSWVDSNTPSNNTGNITG